MTKAIQFANKMSSRNIGVVVADHGSQIEVRVWIGPTTRFRNYTEMVEKKWVRKVVRLSGQQIAALDEAA